MSDASIQFDDREFQKAMNELRLEFPVTNYQVVTNTSKEFLGHVVEVAPHRTGNLRSAARPAWKRLGMPGEPFTTVATGEKTVTYVTPSGKTKEIEVKSEGDYVDNRNISPKTMFRFKLKAWERRHGKWRGYSWFQRFGNRVIKSAKQKTKFDWKPFEKKFKSKSGK